jgi:hypothetical protein
MGALTGAWNHAWADVPTALAKMLARPTVSRGLFITAEGRALLARLTPDVALLRPGQPEVWCDQVDDMVRNLQEVSGAKAVEDLYLQALRLEGRHQSLLLRSGGLSEADEFLALQRLAGEEFATRQPGFWEGLFRGAEPPPIEFVSTRAVGVASAWQRSIQALREIGATNDGAFLLFRTPEGLKIFQRVFGGSRHYRDPVAELVTALELSSERELAIEIAYRVSRAMERFASFGSPQANNLRKAALRRAARDMLPSRVTEDGAFEFLPAAL